MPVKSHQCPEDGLKLTADMKADFDKDGYLLIRGVFSEKEVNHIEKCLTSGSYDDYRYGMYDGEGGEIETVVWNHPGYDVVGMATRCERLVGTSEQLLGGEVYHYHSKINMKNPKVGGPFLWHQDYGYWYDYGGFIKPDMLTTFLAIDKCTKENGCLEVLTGSHKVGRIDHEDKSSMLAANLIRVNELKKHIPLDHVEMEPGDVLFLHCLVLHQSGYNKSNVRRWVLLSAYSRVDNIILDVPNATYKMGYGKPLQKVDNSAVMACNDFTNVEGKEFALTKTDKHPSHLIGKAQKEANIQTVVN